jgi:DNA-binding transcriptional LysR family regulator
VEYNNLPAKRLNEPGGEDKPQIFRTLRNIDLNLLTIFEAVYVHKGIVNAAKILNLTPSAISQSIQKLRAIFPDPLFIRKGQGVTPTAYATHLHEYISQGLESILGALDLTGSYDKQRTITIGCPLLWACW